MKKLNSILFTIMSSLVILLVIIVLVNIIKEMIPTQRYGPDDSIVSNKQVEELVEQNKRSHLISYRESILVDSLKELYLTPISQIKLHEFENITKPILNVVSMEREMEIMQCSNDYSYYMGSGQLNNFIITDLKNNNHKMLYENRTCIVDYELYKIKNSLKLIMLICNEDSNNDGELNGKDLLKLEVFDFKQNKLISISKKPEHLFEIRKIRGADQIIIKQGIDRNNDMKFDRTNEPIILKRLDIDNYKVVSFLDEGTTNKLQAVLDGK